MVSLSRRGFLGGLIAAVAAPAVVRVEGLMRVAPTEIIRAPTNTLLTVDLITREAVELFRQSNPFTEYFSLIPEKQVERLDVLYGTKMLKPEWALANQANHAYLPVQQGLLNLDDFSQKIMTPMVNRLSEQIAKSIMGEQRDYTRQSGWDYAMGLLGPTDSNE